MNYPLEDGRRACFGATDGSTPICADYREALAYVKDLRPRFPVSQAGRIAVGPAAPKPVSGEAGSIFLDRLPAPELLFDFLDLVLAHAEVVPEFVDHGLGDAVADLVVGLEIGRAHV